jgi:uncharacterized membrane protein
MEGTWPARGAVLSIVTLKVASSFFTRSIEMALMEFFFRLFTMDLPSAPAPPTTIAVLILVIHGILI